MLLASWALSKYMLWLRFHSECVHGAQIMTGGAQMWSLSKQGPRGLFKISLGDHRIIILDNHHHCHQCHCHHNMKPIVTLIVITIIVITITIWVCATCAIQVGRDVNTVMTLSLPPPFGTWLAASSASSASSTSSASSAPSLLWIIAIILINIVITVIHHQWSNYYNPPRFYLDFCENFPKFSKSRFLMNFHHCHHDSSPDVTILHQDDLVATTICSCSFGQYWANMGFGVILIKSLIFTIFNWNRSLGQLRSNSWQLMRVTQRLFSRSLSPKGSDTTDRRLSPILTWQGPMVWGDGGVGQYR